jgi:hypothetical protein
VWVRGEIVVDDNDILFHGRVTHCTGEVHDPQACTRFGVCALAEHDLVRVRQADAGAEVKGGALFAVERVNVLLEECEAVHLQWAHGAGQLVADVHSSGSK